VQLGVRDARVARKDPKLAGSLLQHLCVSFPTHSHPHLPLCFVWEGKNFPLTLTTN
jgi:hypothetical protein